MRFDGIVTKNQTKGKIAKCTDFSVGIVEKDGNVTCLGPKGTPWGDLTVGEVVTWHDSHKTLGDNWKKLEEKADELKKEEESQTNDSTSSSSGEIDRGARGGGRVIFTGDINIDPKIGRTA